MAKECRLTTIDNPFDPFDDFDNWYLFDIKESSTYGIRGCCELLAQFSHTSDTMTVDEVYEENERAIDEIISTFPLMIYKKVYRE